MARQLITLTTCEYTLKDGRLLVVARKNGEKSALRTSHRFYVIPALH